MKTLLSEEKVRRAHADGRMRIDLEADTIVTDQARAVARELKIELIPSAEGNKMSHADMQEIISRVQQKMPGMHVSKALIEETVKKIIAGK